MENGDDIVIVGAGIAGLATSLGLHRLGIKSLVLESADSLRTEGFALGIWTNAWKAIDALGIGHVLREKHRRLDGIEAISANTGLTTSEISFGAVGPQNGQDVRCVYRKVLLEALDNELPKGTIRYSSKVVNIEINSHFKHIHLNDGAIIKTKVLIGCDGVNSIVAKFLGFSKPAFAGRTAVRGFVSFENGHGFEPKAMHFFGKGVRYGVIPCDDHGVYWFFSFSPLQVSGFIMTINLKYKLENVAGEEDLENDPTKLKQFIISKLGKVSDKIKDVIERTKLENMICSPLRFRHPWELLFGNISKDNICVVGDALHPMMPDLGQGGCAALEDSIVLARVLAEALKEKSSNDEDYEESKQLRIKKGLEKYVRERKWRNFDLSSTSYIVGLMQQSDGVVLNFIRDKIMAKRMTGMLLKKASFDCGNLTFS